LVIKSLLYSS